VDPMLVVLAVVVILIVGILYAVLRGVSGRGPRLQKLSDESRGRYANQWRTIETRFIDHPREAVREADQLAVAILNERGAELHDHRAVPRRLRDARSAAEGRDNTESLRRAMQQYQDIVDDAVGRDNREAAEHGHREMA